MKLLSIEMNFYRVLLQLQKKPPLGINSTFFIPCDMAMFDIQKVLDDHWNQSFVGHSGKVYPQHGLELDQHLEKMPCILSACNYTMFISRFLGSGMNSLVTQRY